MLKSMTGFGQGELDSNFGRLTVEIKSVNHRYCNITTHVPPQLSNLEPRIHNFIKEHVKRGQVDIAVEINTGESNVSAKLVTVDLQLAKQYYRQLLKLQDEFNLPGDITPEILTRLPGIFAVEEQTISEEQIWHVLEQALISALAKLDSMRQTEGAALHDDLQKRLETIKELLSKIRDHSAHFVTEYNQKLQKRLQELLEGKVEIDESRIIMEAGILAERADITEEIVRLESHCAQFAECLNSEEPVGRQLDFLLQEMLREGNTIGSKTGGTQIANHAVDTAWLCVLLKTEIEKMRELAQNVE